MSQLVDLELKGFQHIQQPLQVTSFLFRRSVPQDWSADTEPSQGYLPYFMRAVEAATSRLFKLKELRQFNILVRTWELSPAQVFTVVPRVAPLQPTPIWTASHGLPRKAYCSKISRKTLSCIVKSSRPPPKSDLVVNFPLHKVFQKLSHTFLDEHSSFLYVEWGKSVFVPLLLMTVHFNWIPQFSGCDTGGRDVEIYWKDWCWRRTVVREKVSSLVSTFWIPEFYCGRKMAESKTTLCVV
jgi:hypothetical protein